MRYVELLISIVNLITSVIELVQKIHAPFGVNYHPPFDF